jgi:aminopeptidase N
MTPIPTRIGPYLRAAGLLIILALTLALAGCNFDGLRRQAGPTPTVPANAGGTPQAQAGATGTATAVIPGMPCCSPGPDETPGAAFTPSVPNTVDSRNVRGCPAPSPGTQPYEMGDPLYPALGNTGYDTLHYDIALSADLGTNVLSGTVTIRARAAQDLTDFYLDFQDFGISSLTVDGAEAKYDRTGDEMKVTPASPLKNGQEFTVAVAYNGEPEPEVDTSAPIPLGWVPYDTGVYVASEPAGAHAWYPVNDHPCDKAAYTIRITVAKPYVVAANGTLKSTTDNGDTTTYVWDAPYPMASYLTTVNIAEFQTQETQGPNGMTIRNYFPADIQNPGKAFERTPDMIDLFNSLFGPYPFDVYGVVVADTDLNWALETQTMSLFGRGFAQGRGIGYEIDETIAHELSHQWFGDSVSLKSWKDIWLNEGFATYAQMLWTEHSRSRSAMDNEVRSAYRSLARADLPPVADPPGDDLFNAGVYYRGGLTLHALRLEVGDDTFFRILQTYYDRFRNGNANTKDFIDTANEVSGKDLTAFFDAWLYQTEMPPIPQMQLP